MIRSVLRLIIMLNLSEEIMTIPENVPQSVPILDEDYDDFLEWTEEDEEAFLKIMADEKEEK